MRKLLLLLIIWGMSLNSFSQMQISELTFVFEDQNTFTEQFQDKENSKQFSFLIEGITTILDAQALEQIVRNMRGVEEFKMEIITGTNQYNAKLKVYKYANGWWYWKTFMQKVGVPNFRIAAGTYNSETILTIN